MKTGVCVLHQRGKSISDSFKAIREHGFDNCQLVSWDVTLWTEQEADQIKKAMKRHDVAITAFWCGWRGPKVWDFYEGQETLGIVPVTYRSMRVSDLCKGGDFAGLLGVKDIITHAGFLPENPFAPEYPGVLSALRTVARHYLRHGQNLLLETGQETPVTLARTIEDIATGNVFVNLDPANLIMYGKGNPVDALEILGRYIRGVHAKDGLCPTDGKNLGTETAMGEGKANFPALVRSLKALGYDGSLTIEREIEGDEQIRDILAAKELLEDLISQD